MRTWWRGMFLAGLTASAIGLTGCGEKPKPRASGEKKPDEKANPGAVVAPGGVAIANDTAKVASPKGSVLVRAESADSKLDQMTADSHINDYKVVDSGFSLEPGQTVLSFHDGAVVSGNGKVTATLRSDLSGKNPLPVLESAIKTRAASPGIDFEFKFDRGRVDLVNTAKEGKVTVRIHGPFTSSDLVLATPGTRVVVEVYGRWMPGTQFAVLPADTKYTPENSPLMRLLILVLKGEAEIIHPRNSFRLIAPPGNAQIQAQSRGDAIVVPEHLDAVPDWVNENPKDPEVAKHKPAIDKLASLLAKEADAEKVFEELGNSKDPVERLIAVYGLAALDELEKMFILIRTTRTPELVDEGIIALRHFMGRAPGNDQLFYKFLTTHKIGGRSVFTPKQAEAFIDLLDGFNEEQREQPSTYLYLLKQLSNEKAPIRGLAIWHLNRLVPEGQKIGYDPTDDAPSRELAVKKWKDKLTELKKLPEAPPAPKPPTKPAAPKP